MNTLRLLQSFFCALLLSCTLSAQAAQAVFDNGKLQLTLPDNFEVQPGSADALTAVLGKKHKHKIVFEIAHRGENLESEETWLKNRAKETKNELTPRSKPLSLLVHPDNPQFQDAYVQSQVIYAALDGVTVSVSIYMPESAVPAEAKSLPAEQQALFLAASGTLETIRALREMAQILKSMQVLK